MLTVPSVSQVRIHLLNPHPPLALGIFIAISVLQLENPAAGRVGIENGAVCCQSPCWKPCAGSGSIACPTFWIQVIIPLVSVAFYGGHGNSLCSGATEEHERA